MKRREIHITELDMARLRQLLKDASRSGHRPDLASLEAELRHACVVPAQEIPEDVVTMHSQVVLRDQDAREQATYTLVFPGEADLERNRVSVLTPIGTAMLGRRKGNAFEWQVPGGLRSSTSSSSRKRLASSISSRRHCYFATAHLRTGSACQASVLIGGPCRQRISSIRSAGSGGLP